MLYSGSLLFGGPVIRGFTVVIPYSRKFSLVQIFAEKHPDSSEEIFAVFIFAEHEML